MKALTLSFLSTLATAAPYSSSQGMTSVYISKCAAFGHLTYPSLSFTNVPGFQLTAVLYDSFFDTNGFVGYLPSDDSIYIAFQGSESTTNWLTDFDATKTQYTSYPECNCQVHQGFYLAQQAVLDQVLTAVADLKLQYPTALVKTTGHSLGAAIATLTAMDLAKTYPDVQSYNYGSPRVGDPKFSAFAGTIMTDFWRVTHYKDCVPHVP